MGCWRQLLTVLRMGYCPIWAWHQPTSACHWGSKAGGILRV
jgi:hypothetical protein